MSSLVIYATAHGKIRVFYVVKIYYLLLLRLLEIQTTQGIHEYTCRHYSHLSRDAALRAKGRVARSIKTWSTHHNTSTTNHRFVLNLSHSVYYLCLENRLHCCRLLQLLSVELDLLFSSPEPKAQVSYCHSAPSVVRPSSVRPSVVRPSVCKLSHFQLLLQNRLMDFDETW